jgi:endo-alpha-N-acetylgalactosaminidase
MKVQEKPFVPRKAPPAIKKTTKASTLKRIGGRIAKVSSFNPGHEKENILDGDAVTFWHTRFKPDFAPPPHFVVLEVPAGTSVAGLSYSARSQPNGRVLGYVVYVSDDASTWGGPVVKGRFDSGTLAEQKVVFPEPTTEKFIKFETTDAVSAGGQSIAAIGELDVLVK